MVGKAVRLRQGSPGRQLHLHQLRRDRPLGRGAALRSELLPPGPEGRADAADPAAGGVGVEWFGFGPGDLVGSRGFRPDSEHRSPAGLHDALRAGSERHPYTGIGCPKPQVLAQLRRQRPDETDRGTLALGPYEFEDLRALQPGRRRVRTLHRVPERGRNQDGYHLLRPARPDPGSQRVPGDRRQGLRPGRHATGDGAVRRAQGDQRLRRRRQGGGLPPERAPDQLPVLRCSRESKGFVFPGMG